MDGARAISLIVIHSMAPDGLTIAALCARANMRVHFVADAPESVPRLRDQLARLGAGEIQVHAPTMPAPEADLTLVAKQHAPPPAGLVATTAEDTKPYPNVLFAGPLSHRRLVEIVPNGAEETEITALVRWAHALGKTPIVTDRALVPDLWDVLLGALDRVLLAGALHTEIDAACEQAGADLGLCAAQDLIGLDRAYTRRRAARAPRLLAQDRMIEEGRLGKQASVGWYRYPGGGGAVEDPLIEDLIAEEAHFAAIPHLPTDAQDALDQILRAAHRHSQTLIDGGIPPDALTQAWAGGIGLPRAWARRLVTKTYQTGPDPQPEPTD